MGTKIMTGQKEMKLVQSIHETTDYEDIIISDQTNISCCVTRDCCSVETLCRKNRKAQDKSQMRQRTERDKKGWQALL